MKNDSSPLPAASSAPVEGVGTGEPWKGIVQKQNADLAAWYRAYPRMALDSKPGTLVVFDGRGGYPGQEENAAKHFEYGRAYEVRFVQVGHSSSEVYLRGVERGFNTVMFATLPAADSGDSYDWKSEALQHRDRLTRIGRTMVPEGSFFWDNITDAAVAKLAALSSGASTAPARPVCRNPKECDESQHCLYGCAATPAGEAAEVQADAKRYRWLQKERNVMLVTGFFGNGCVNRTVQEVDAAIDAAMSAAPPSPAAQEGQQL